jgi:hypothetical protein
MADTADRKPFRSDDDLPADGQGGVDPLLELSQIAGFEPEGGAEPDERQIDLEDALLAELAPQEAPTDDVASEADEPVDLPPFIGGEPDFDASAVTDEPSAPAMEAELSQPMPEPAPVMEVWPPVPSEAETAPPADAVEDVPAFLSTPAPDPDAAPEAASLEDELAAMLAGDTSPAPADDMPVADAEPAMAAPLANDMAPLPDDAGLAPVTESPAAHDIDPTPDETPAEAVETLPTEAFDPAPAETALFEAAPAEPTPADDLAADQADIPAPIWDEPSAPDTHAADWPDQADAVPEPDMAVAAPEAPSFDDDFAAAFDEELSAVDGADTVADDPFAPPASADTTPADDLLAEPEPLDPVDELAAIMGYEPATPDSQPDAVTNDDPAGDVERTLDELDADFQSALDADLSGDLAFDDNAGAMTAPATGIAAANGAAAPVLDTVDMTAFEEVPASDFDVPEFDQGNEQSAATATDPDAMFADDQDHQPFDAGQPDDHGADGAMGAATAAAMTNAFDSAQFEAELARDMEFVSHDLNAERSADGLDLAAEADSAAPAQAERSGRRGMMIGLVVAALAVVGVGGVLALSGGGDTVDEGPVLVEADDTPVKIEPDDPGGTTVPNQDRAVFADGDTVAPAQQNLVSTAEEPVDIATAPADGLPAAVAVGEKSEDRLTEGGTESATSDAVTPITPRRVRTLIVRPDGTLEERAPAPVETAAANPASQQPAATGPVVAQEVPAAAAPQTVAGVPVSDAAEPDAPQASVAAAEATNDTPAQTAPSQTSASAPAETAPVVVRRVQTTTATPPVIRDRPSDQPVNVVNRQQVASAPAAAPAPAPQAAAPAQQDTVPVTTTSGSTGFAVQLAALPSEAAARATATRLSQQYGNLIAGRGLSIQRAVIDGRGTFYRVRVAANGSGDANALCNSIKASGGNCFVAR